MSECGQRGELWLACEKYICIAISSWLHWLLTLPSSMFYTSPLTSKLLDWFYCPLLLYLNSSFFKNYQLSPCSQSLFYVYTFTVAQSVKSLPAMRETWIWFLGWEDLLEKECQPTRVFLPGEFHGQRSLMGYSPSSHRESDMTEWLTHTHTQTHTLPSILISNKENHFSYLWLISIHIIDLFFQLCPGIIYQLFPSHYESFISQSLFSVSIDMHSTLFHYLNFFSIFSHHIFLLLTVKVILHLSLFFILLPSPFTVLLNYTLTFGPTPPP